MNSLLFSFDEIASACAGEWLVPPKNPADGVSRIMTDSRQDCSGSLFIALKGENFDGHAFLQNAVAAGAKALLASTDSASSVPKDAAIPVMLARDTTKAYQDLARFHKLRFPALKVVALTGSNGKTSTKEMLRSIFAAAHGEGAVLATEGNTNNHVGVPQNMLRLTSAHKVCVLEMGTNHHGEIEPLSATAEPDAAIITLIGNSHLEHFGGLDGVAREKSTIFSHMKKNGTAIIPEVGPEMKTVEKAASNFKTLRFGTGDGADVRVEYLGGDIAGASFNLVFKDSGAVEKVSWRLSGIHQAVNAAAAAAAARALGVPHAVIAEGLSKCALPGMRMKISERDGVTWINDAYNANPDSMRAAFKWLAEFAPKSSLHIVIGDMLEMGGFAENAHKEIISEARLAFPAAKINVVGKHMRHALASMTGLDEVSAFETSADAAPAVNKDIARGDFIFLKGSRGVRLETVQAWGEK